MTEKSNLDKSRDNLQHLIDTCERLITEGNAEIGRIYRLNGTSPLLADKVAEMERVETQLNAYKTAMRIFSLA